MHVDQVRLEARAIDWPARPAMTCLLNYDGSRANLAAADKIADLDLDDVAPAQLAVDREIEHRVIAKPALPIKPKPDGPDLLKLQCPFGSEPSARVPRSPLLATGSYCECPIALHLLATVGPSDDPGVAAPGMKGLVAGRGEKRPSSLLGSFMFS